MQSCCLQSHHLAGHLQTVQDAVIAHSRHIYIHAQTLFQVYIRHHVDREAQKIIVAP